METGWSSAHTPRPRAELHDQRPTLGLEHAPHFGERAGAGIFGQVMHRERAKHDIERGVGEGKRLRSGNLELDRQAATGGLTPWLSSRT
jgi:hypothetical protein